MSDPSDVVRRFAVEVLARLHDPDAAGLLVRTAMLDADWWVRERAVEALAAFGVAGEGLRCRHAGIWLGHRPLIVAGPVRNGSVPVKPGLGRKELWAA